jgi:hypothetical protein
MRIERLVSRALRASPAQFAAMLRTAEAAAARPLRSRGGLSERTERRWGALLSLRMLASPALQEMLRARRHKLRRRKWPIGVGRHVVAPDLGRELGGRPPPERRCTKRLGSKLCWNWRDVGLDRCRRHPRAVRSGATRRR